MNQQDLQMTEAVENWDAVFKKGVRSNDDAQVGTVVGVTGDNVVIERGSREIYAVPKAEVQGFDGNEIVLNLSKNDLSAYQQKD
jgi:hypothetical protein